MPIMQEGAIRAACAHDQGSRRRDAVQSIRHQTIVASQDALDAECRTGGRVGISIARADGPMTAIIYFGEMLVATMLAIVLLAISQLRMSSDAMLFGGGFVAWTLAEYVVHRFVLHGFAPTEHRLHHASPDEAVLTIFWQIWVCFSLVYLIVGGAFVAGALIAYSWYLFVHHRAHHGPDKLPLPLLKHHRSHHQFATRNYGVSTTLWDHVFGTVLR
jgi:sterol desaturase/sphingolipid hydroxylase (fatty acid hydroxylase superfamily)